MKVHVLPPIAKNNVVRFRWTADGEIPYLHRNNFFLGYEGLNTSWFSDDLWYEILFAILSRVLGKLEEPVEMIFPAPISRGTVDYWTARHGVSDRLHVPDTRADMPLSPWTGAPVQVGEQDIALLLGGGKDSLACLGVLNELYGPERIMPIHWIAPFSRGADKVKAVAERAQRTLIAPLQEIAGIRTRRAWSDYRSLITREMRDSLLPDMELLHTASIPLYLANGCKFAAHAKVPWSALPVREDKAGILHGPRPNNRPEAEKLEQRHHQRLLGIDIRLTNPTVALSAPRNIEILLTRYPKLAPIISTCNRIHDDEQFCFNCEKCFYLGVILLSQGHTPKWFDFDRMFGNLVYFDKMLGPEPESLPRDDHGNLVYEPRFGPETQFNQLCEALFLIDPTSVDPLLRVRARRRLRQLKQLMGNHHDDWSSKVPAEIGEWNDDPLSREVMRLFGELYDLTPGITGPYMRGKDLVRFDFHRHTRPKTAAVAHLQD